VIYHVSYTRTKEIVFKVMLFIMNDYDIK
jgi:hypothetical protein